MTGPGPRSEGSGDLNLYARLIVDEARRRGISVEVVDDRIGELVLTLGERRVTTIESLSELTSAVAYRRCHDKLHTRRVLEGDGLRMSPGRAATFDEEDRAFVERYKDVVVKPARGEQGEGVTVGVLDGDGLDAAMAKARAICADVVLERRCDGDDVRVVVIDGHVVGASVRRPPTVTGDGRTTVGDLIDELNRSLKDDRLPPRAVPVDDATRDAVRAGGYGLDDVLPEGEELVVRRTANLHTGGSVEDVTARLHPQLVAVAERAARAIGIPVVGVDLIVSAVDATDYVIIEANEQPGLSSYGSQQTVERFVDLLFPESCG